MKKKQTLKEALFPPFKIDLKVKLTTILLFLALLNVRGNVYAQKLSIEATNTTIEAVMENIEQNSDFRFIYKISDIDLNRIVSFSAKDKPIETILYQLFAGTRTEFKIIGAQIIVKKGELIPDKSYLQNIIKGKVTDENGMPLPGATVVEDGTKKTTLTDFDGNFELAIQGESTNLTISYVGYEDFKIKASGTAVAIQMKPDTGILNEVVVIGYGSTTRKDVTGAVSSIQAKDMNQGALVNPLQLIAGKLAGVSVTQTGSEPGSAPSVRIRGVGSLIGGNDPLVVVDGIQGNLELLNQIPPSEIASMDVLKDASATAIYGSRGAPGVIIVTTKKSKSGKGTLEYNASTSIDFIPKKLDMLSASEWWTVAQQNGVPASANHGSNTDWYDLLTQTGITQSHTLSFGAGTDTFNYRASVSAILQDGVVTNSDSQKYIGRIQATQMALEGKLKLTFDLNTGIIDGNSTVQSIGRANFISNLITNAYLMRPTDPVYNTDGTYYTDPNVFQYLNPYAVTQTVTNESKANNLFGALKAELDLGAGFSAGWFGSWRKTDLMIGFFLPVESTSANAIDQKGFANINNKHSNEKLMNMSLGYKKSFGDHSVNGLVLYEWQNQEYQGNYAQARGFINNIATYNALQLGDLSKVQPGDLSSYKNDRTLVSFLGRVNYAYKSRYLFTASMRRDGSSVFGINNKWGNFPSASVGWQIDQEPFMAGQNVFNELKLRGGYGETGNQQGLNPQGSISLVGNAGVTYFGGQQITNFNVTQNANADLRWETKKQTNIGLDFALLNSRVRGTLDVYTAKTDNLLFGYTVSQPPFPFSTIEANVGSIRNRGIELSLGYDIIKNDNLTLTLSGNASLLDNKVLSLSGTINGVPVNSNYVPWGPNAYLVEGEAIGTYHILHHTGVDDERSETVLDANGDGIIDQGNLSTDRLKKGSALPKYTYAFNPVLRWKNLDASMLFKGSGGNKIYNTLRQTLSYQESIGKANILQSAVPLGIYTSKYGSDLWLEDASFLRIENVTIGYSFNLKNVRYIESLRLSITGNNLATFTKYSGIDPELNLSGGGDNFGDDKGIYPRTRTFALGLNVKFK